jgi:hypothetical protein
MKSSHHSRAHYTFSTEKDTLLLKIELVDPPSLLLHGTFGGTKKFQKKVYITQLIAKVVSYKN